MKKHSNNHDGLVWGIILIVLGCIFLIQKIFNIEILSQIWQFWPVALIIWGVLLIVNKK